MLAWLDELIREAASGAHREWENPTVDRYLEAMGAWLSARPEPASDSPERRMIGHILFPPGDFKSFADYFAAVKHLVESPPEEWPYLLAFSDIIWGVIGVALRAGRHYE